MSKPTKLAVCTDLHLGVRNSSRVFRDLMRSYIKDVFFPKLKENGITDILFGGDFFDSRTSINLNDIDYVSNEFLPLLDEYGINFHAILGNHDVAYRNTNRVNSMSMFKGHSRVKLVEDEVIKFEVDGDKDFLLCPWLNDENEDRLLEDLKHYASDDYIVLGHFEINGMPMYKNSKLCEGGVDPKFFKKYHRVLSGHFHTPSKYGNVEYIGAMFHTTWQDHNDWRGFYIYDSKNNEFEPIENEYCLYTKLTYNADLLKTSNEDLETLCEGQFVRIIINESYDKLELKDLLHRIEECKPVKVDIIDNTILDSSNSTDDTNDDLGDEHTQSILDHASVYFNDEQDMVKLFKSIFEQAKQEMKEVE